MRPLRIARSFLVSLLLLTAAAAQTSGLDRGRWFTIEPNQIRWERTDELGELARTFREMGTEIVERERREAERAELEDDRSPLHPMRLYAELGKVLDRDAIVIGDGGDFVGAALTFQLPAWNRNQGGRGQTQGERTAAQRRQEFLKSGGFETQIRILRAASAAALERAELFSSKAVPAFDVALHSQEQLYTAGKGNVIQVWQTLRSYNDAQVEGLALWLEAMTNRIQLSLLVGEEV